MTTTNTGSSNTGSSSDHDGSSSAGMQSVQPIAGLSQQEAQLARVLAEHAAYLGACQCGWTPARGITATPGTWAAHVAAAVLPELGTAAAIRAFVERVDRRAEADMVAGNPLEGAHYRAMRVEMEALDEDSGDGSEPT